MTGSTHLGRAFSAAIRASLAALRAARTASAWALRSRLARSSCCWASVVRSWTAAMLAVGPWPSDVAAAGVDEEAWRASPMAPGTFIPETAKAARVAAVTYAGPPVFFGRRCRPRERRGGTGRNRLVVGGRGRG